MVNPMKEDAEAVLRTYRVDGAPLFLVGMFDTGVTVHSQQVRALNFAWSAIESGFIKSATEPALTSKKKKSKVAIVGGGFAGLTVAAGLLMKGADVSITIFEQRDTLLPLQQGSDSRWLHPRIYDWPGEGTEASAAWLPVLNWTAARASDVVVQILAGWKKIVSAQGDNQPTLYCNAGHLQIHETGRSSRRLQIEWVGEPRNPIDGTASGEAGTAAVGRSDAFDVVILATGFGLERDGALSYWRNETVGQPSLDQPRQTFLVSGQGDGAMIDLLRLRISQFRQDRILDELFRGRTNLLNSVKAMHKTHSQDSNKKGLFKELEQLAIQSDIQVEFEEVRKELFSRLRRDTEVILHLRVKKLSELLDPETTRISFQNKLLVYLLYKCGGFTPSSLDETDLVVQYAIHSDRIIRRHGTTRDEQLNSILSGALYGAIEKRRGNAKPDPFTQIDKQRWTGGYFGFPGRLEDNAALGDKYRVNWRREYLPGPTELLANTFCSSLAGILLERHPSKGRLRVTLHRAMPMGDEELLQQACDYSGTNDARGENSSAARTFPARNATIGLAYKCRQIVRSKKGVGPSALQSAMSSLSLKAAARGMNESVGFVLAIPLLEPDLPNQYTVPAPVVGIIYIDSNAKGFFINEKELRGLVKMAQEFLDGLVRAQSRPFDRIRNVRFAGLGKVIVPAEALPKNVRKALELVGTINAPRTSEPFQLNYDYSDFVSTQGT